MLLFVILESIREMLQAPFMESYQVDPEIAFGKVVPGDVLLGGGY